MHTIQRLLPLRPALLAQVVELLRRLVIIGREPEIRHRRALFQVAVALHFDLGNGLKMDPHIMDLAARELRYFYRYHGHPDVDSHTILKKKNRTLLQQFTIT